MGHVERRGSRYRARYRGSDGRERSKTFDRLVQAESFISMMEADKARGLWIDPALSRTTVEAWTERWIATTVHLKPKTRAGYESLLRHHVLPRFGSIQLGRVDRLDVQSWVSEMQSSGLSASRTRQAKQVLGALMGAAQDSGYIAKNPAARIKLPRETPREMLHLSAVQVESLVAAVPDVHRPLIYVLTYGGIRWGEAAALRRKHLRLDRSRIEISESLAEVGGKLYFGSTKNYRRRSVSIPEFLVTSLRQTLSQEHAVDLERLLFRSSRGHTLRNSNFRRRVWIPAVRDADVPDGLRIHDLRHTCASLLIAEGAHPKVIQQHLGHSSINVTMDRYGHLFPSQMDEYAERLGTTKQRATEQYAASARPELPNQMAQVARISR